jgi:hypothetical protein
MQPWAWVLLIVVLVVVALLVAALMRQRRTANLRDRFGPEYDRTINTADDKRGAEQELLDRARRREKLDIRPLPEAARARYAEQWRAIQERFIDDPAGSVGSAHTLLDQVMAERGYPTRNFEEQADLVSVDHPRVVEDYRAAYAIYQRQGSGQASTEDLRDALVRYRSLFEDLLRPEGGAARDRTDDRADTRTDPRTDVRDGDRDHGDLTGDRADYGADHGADYRTDHRTNGPAAGVTGERYDGTTDGRSELPADERADGVTQTRPDVGPSSTTYGERS